MWDDASPQDIITFLQRIDSTVVTNNTPHDAWVAFLRKNGGGNGTLNDMEINYINTQSAISGKTTGDAANHYLSAKGFSGSPKDKLNGYLRGSATK